VAGPKRKIKGAARKVRKKTVTPPLDPLRTGMPAQDSITGVDQYRKGKKVLRIIHTNERDAYDADPGKTGNKE